MVSLMNVSSFSLHVLIMKESDVFWIQRESDKNECYELWRETSHPVIVDLMQSGMKKSKCINVFALESFFCRSKKIRRVKMEKGKHEWTDAKRFINSCPLSNFSSFSSCFFLFLFSHFIPLFLPPPTQRFFMNEQHRYDSCSIICAPAVECIDHKDPDSALSDSGSLECEKGKEKGGRRKEEIIDPQRAERGMRWNWITCW